MSLQKTTYGIRKRLADPCFVYLVEMPMCPTTQMGQPGHREKVTSGKSPETGSGDCLEGSQSRTMYRTMVSQSLVQELQPVEAEPEGEKAEDG